MAENPFSKSFGFFQSFSTNFLVLYMPRPLTHGDIVLLHCGSHSVTLCHKHTAFSLPLSLTLYDINTPASHSC